MSKDKPEVGDVFHEIRKQDGYMFEVRYVIISEYVNGSYYVVCKNYVFTYGVFMDKADFEKLTYLGKSKVDRDDLFKTENEE